MSLTAAVPAAAPDAAAVPGGGRTTIAPRALNRVAAAVTADTFGVTAGAVHVELSDRDGLLALRVRSPIRILSLERVRQAPAVVETSGGTLLRQAARAQTTIRERVATLTGAEIAHVTVELSGVETRPESRVA